MTDFFCHLEEMVFPSPAHYKATSSQHRYFPLLRLPESGKAKQPAKDTVSTIWLYVMNSGSSLLIKFVNINLILLTVVFQGWFLDFTGKLSPAKQHRLTNEVYERLSLYPSDWAYSFSFSFSIFRARCRRERTVPMGISMIFDISS